MKIRLLSVLRINRCRETQLVQCRHRAWIVADDPDVSTRVFGLQSDQDEHEGCEGLSLAGATSSE